MFQGVDIIEFLQEFSNDETCKKYLSDIKWKDGFICKNCNHTGWCKTKKPYVRKCNKCKHKESVTAGTLFHKVKFPLYKAFFIVFIMSTSKKSWSSEEFSRKLSLRQKTCWLFQHKVREAMSSSKNFPITTKAVVDEFSVGGPEKNKKGRSKGKKKQAVMAIEYNDFGILRCYCKTIDGAGTKQIKPFIEDYIDVTAEIKTDKWRGYNPIKSTYPKLEQVESKKGKNFPLIHRQIMMLKGWLRGIHHHCKHLQGYLNEYCYRFNRLKSTNTIFNNLITRMINRNPLTLNQLKFKWGT